MELSLKINQLRIFFNFSVACFDFQRAVSNIFKTPNKLSEMYELHLKAKSELDKENPDLQVVESLLIDMENLAEKNSKKQYDVGGIVSKNQNDLDFGEKIINR